MEVEAATPKFTTFGNVSSFEATTLFNTLGYNGPVHYIKFVHPCCTALSFLDVDIHSAKRLILQLVEPLTTTTVVVAKKFLRHSTPNAKYIYSSYR